MESEKAFGASGAVEAELYAIDNSQKYMSKKARAEGKITRWKNVGENDGEETDCR